MRTSVDEFCVAGCLHEAVEYVRHNMTHMSVMIECLLKFIRKGVLFREST